VSVPSAPLAPGGLAVSPELGARAGRFSVVTTVSLAIVAALVAAALLAPILPLQDPDAVNLLSVLNGPSSHHLLGTDSAGRDILSRLVFGTRVSMLGPLFVIALATIVGVPLGLIAGFRGGWVDGVLSRIFDVIFAFPPLILAIVIVATFGPGFKTAVLAVAVTYVPLMARVTRSGALVEREKPYVDACRVQGYGTFRICFRHIGPSLSRLVVSQLAVYFAYSLLDLAALSFLGLGTQPPTADWGGMLADAQQSIFESATGVIPPAVAIVLLVVSFSLVADRVVDRNEWR
jgi:peptide/nickel transport system permease protein